MIYLLDKTDCLYQWDSDRQVAIDNPNITEMHFCRKRDSKAVVVDVVVEDGVATAFIPNFLLQTADDILVFAYEHIHPEEYETYQAFRVECKAAVDAEMAALKAELEAILNQ